MEKEMLSERINDRNGSLLLIRRIAYLERVRSNVMLFEKS